MSTEQRTASLLVEAARWRLVELLFERPRDGWHAEVRALAGEVDDARLAAAARSAEAVEEGWYLSVFGPGGSVSPREVGYRPMGDPARILSNLRGIYEAFGYRPRAEDPPDHVAVEAGFVGFMKLKQAYAAARHDSASQKAAGKGVEGFVEEHLAGFAAELTRRLERSGLEHMVRAALVLEQWCPGTAPQRGMLPVVNNPVVPAIDDDDPFPSCEGNCPAPAPEQV